MLDQVCNSEIHKSQNIESLLCIERSHLRWFGHVNRIPQERIPKQALSAISWYCKSPVGQPRSSWLNHIESFGAQPQQDKGDIGGPRCVETKHVTAATTLTKKRESKK